MNIKKALIFLLFLFTIVLVAPKTSKAFDLPEVFISENSVVTKIYEGMEYIFAFKLENKVSVLEKHAEKRLVAAQEYAQEGNNERVQNMVESYQQIKEKQYNLLEKVNDGEVLGTVTERTVEQQKMMEEIKIKVNEDTKQNVIQIQEQVVNQVAKHVIEVNGTEGATEFLNEVVHVWAPGTEPPAGSNGGEAGVVYSGGGKLIYAEGTGPGEGGIVIEGGKLKFATGASMDSPGADIKNVEIITGGTINEPVPVGGDMNITTDTNLNGPVNTIDDSYDDNNWTIDP